MKTWVLRREQWIPAPLGRVFPFFADAANLQRITPPWLRFSILTPLPIEMAPGAQIEYRLRLAGIPVRWRTRIAEWKPGDGFVDVQERGPYALWEHTHRFQRLGEGVLTTDVVRYALPLSWLGRVAQVVAVRAALAAIFDYRAARIAEVFRPSRGEV